jgi:hypothetical protein
MAQGGLPAGQRCSVGPCDRSQQSNHWLFGRRALHGSRQYALEASVPREGNANTGGVDLPGTLFGPEGASPRSRTTGPPAEQGGGLVFRGRTLRTQ